MVTTGRLCFKLEPISAVLSVLLFMLVSLSVRLLPNYPATPLSIDFFKSKAGTYPCLDSCYTVFLLLLSFLGMVISFDAIFDRSQFLPVFNLFYLNF